MHIRDTLDGSTPVTRRPDFSVFSSFHWLSGNEIKGKSVVLGLLVCTFFLFFFLKYSNKTWKKYACTFTSAQVHTENKKSCTPEKQQQHCGMFISSCPKHHVCWRRVSRNPVREDTIVTLGEKIFWLDIWEGVSVPTFTPVCSWHVFK